MMATPEEPVETPKQGFVLSEAMYTKMKFLVQIVLPGLGTLYFTLSKIWGLPGAEQVVGTLSALAIFFGLLLGLSTRNYETSSASHEGVMHISEREDGAGVTYLLELTAHPEDLNERGQIRLKVDNQLPPPPPPSA